MPLTDTAVRNAKPGAKPVKISDERGLHLMVTPSGGKLWRFRYAFDGKEKLLSFGAYPDVSLADARDRRDQARKQIANGIDPSEQRKAAKATRAGLAANTFEVIAREWYAKAMEGKADTTKEKLLRRLEVDVFPWIGARPISEIAPADLVRIIERMESRGAVDLAKRVHNAIMRIFRYAVTKGFTSSNPAQSIDLNLILPQKGVQHHASVTDPKAVGELLRAIDGFTGAFITRCALHVAAYTFVRPGNLRHAEWTEIDFDKAEWRIQAGKMKMKEQHIIPLSTQVIAILKEIQPLTGSGRYVFPSERGQSAVMSENTINGALRRLGYAKEEMTGHGFRSMASTLLHELGLPHAVIERQLAHGERNKVSAAYNFAEYLPERRKMMQQWADYLDKLKVGAEVIPLHGNAA
jgi:integrase